MRIDVVMWAKNGALMLPRVLGRIDEVIPHEAVNRKVFIDDHSVDGSVPIARDFGWLVSTNDKGGVGAGANAALRQVTTECFVSLEQDIVLARDWWERIPRYLERKDVAVAQGWRISDHPVVGKIDEYSMDKITEEYSTDGIIVNALCSIDNTIYRTKAIRALGGFPEHLKHTGVDVYVHQRVCKAGLEWVTDCNVLSTHLRMGGLKEEMQRYYLYGMDTRLLAREEFFREVGVTSRLTRSASIAFFSPFRALEIAFKKRCPRVVYYYPMIRFSHFGGYLKGRTAAKEVQTQS